jgi:hypothetical protein
MNFIVFLIGVSLWNRKSVSSELSCGGAVLSPIDIPTRTRRRITSTPPLCFPTCIPRIVILNFTIFPDF